MHDWAGWTSSLFISAVLVLASNAPQIRSADAMVNIRFLWDNQLTALATTLTASSESTGLPVTAIQDPDRTRVWRSATQTGAHTIDIDLGSIKAVNAVALANSTRISGGVFELAQRGDGSTPGSAQLVATLPAQNPDRKVSVVFFTSQSHRHWRLTATNPGAVSAFAELGYGFLGTYLEPSINVSVPMDIEEIDPSVVRRSLDGQRSTTNRARFSSGRFSWTDLPDADRDNLRTMWGAIGTATPMFTVLDSALGWTAWLLHMQESLSQRFAVIANRYDLGFDFEEAR